MFTKANDVLKVANASYKRLSMETSKTTAKKKAGNIKAVLGMLARGTEAWKYGPMEEEAGSAYDCKTKH